MLRALMLSLDFLENEIEVALMDAVKDDPFEVIEAPEPEVIPLCGTTSFVAPDVEDEGSEHES